MSKKLQLQIPTPCHENWENMTPAVRGRFCASCQKQVVDFSNMSDREIAVFFKKPSMGSVCGRFMEDQLSRDIEIPKKRIPWVKYFFQLTLPAFLASCGARTQGKIKVVSESKTLVAKKAEEKIAKEPTEVIVGKPSKIVVDADIITLPRKKFNPESENEKSTILPDENVPSVINEQSYLEKFVAETPQQLQKQLQGSADAVSVRLGGVVAKCYINKTSKSATFFKRIFKDAAFKIYPNPLRSNSALYIEWRQNEFGDHALQLFDQSGRLIFTKDIYIDKEARLLDINIPFVAAGNYFLKIVNRQTAGSYTGKLIIE